MFWVNSNKSFDNNRNAKKFENALNKFQVSKEEI